MKRYSAELVPKELSISALLGKFTAVSCYFGNHGMPMSITLWRSDNKGIRFQTPVVEVEDRYETGIIKISLLDGKEKTDAYEKLIVETDFNVEAVSKLVYLNRDLEFLSDAGVSLYHGDGKASYIVPGAFPYAIAACGELFVGMDFDPENLLSEYSSVDFA